MLSWPENFAYKYRVCNKCPNVPSIWGFCYTPKKVLSAMISFIGFINLMTMTLVTLVTSKLGSLDSHFTKIEKMVNQTTLPFWFCLSVCFSKQGPSFNNYLEHMQLSHKNAVFYHMSCLGVLPGGFVSVPRFPSGSLEAFTFWTPGVTWNTVRFGWSLNRAEMAEGWGWVVNGDTEKMADMPLFTG